jgi:hypothetical protein
MKKEITLTTSSPILITALENLLSHMPSCEYQLTTKMVYKEPKPEILNESRGTSLDA